MHVHFAMPSMIVLRCMIFVSLLKVIAETVTTGGDVVLLYASKYCNIPAVVNVSGRYDLNKGIEERFGEDFMEKIKQEGFIDVKNKTGDSFFLSRCM